MKPITTRAKQNGGIIKGCGCGKTPAKMYNSPVKMGCGKNKY